MSSPHSPIVSTSRRGFLKASALTAGATLIPTAVRATGSDVLKIALIGCGGRGSGAAANALNADPHVKLWAACDIFGDRLTAAVNMLSQQFNGRVEVPPERQFTGFDGYKHAIDSGPDVVILATPPGFRPLHFAYAVEQGKHVFMEKPHAVDAAGVRSVLESAKLAEQKGLGVCAGFTFRYDRHKREMLKRIHDGMIGDVLAIHTTYLTGELWHRGDNPEWSEMERQIRNWYYYTWLSGDFLVEQAIHNVDKAMWVLRDRPPVAATGMGGRQVRTDHKFGNIWDHFAVVYEWDDGAKVFLQCRQQAGCQNDVSDHVIGSKGHAHLMRHTITAGGLRWRIDDENNLNEAYQREHEELLQSIRAGTPMNDAIRSATSTLVGILGREAAYTGQRITWKQIANSKQDLSPKGFGWGPNPVPPVAMPGKTKFV